MLVSIIVPVYNSEEYLYKLLKNLIQQTYTQIEIILIDDGSTDKSLEICNEFKQKDNRIKILSKENEGVSIARNKGMELATGDYITFLDSDDTLDINYIKELVENVEENTLVRCNNIGLQDIVEKSEYIKEVVNGKIQGVCWGYLFKRELIEDIKFDENTSYMEDTLFIIQVLFKVQQIKVVKTAIYNYNVNQGGLTKNSNNIEKRLNGYIYSINKINEILKLNNIFYDDELNSRKIKLLEAEFAKVTNEKTIKSLLENTNVIQIIKQSKPSLKYKYFMHLIRKGNSKKIMKYIQARNRIKKIVKGNK